MFIDTSAIVAVLTREPSAERLIAQLTKAERPFTAPHVRLESVMVLATRFDREPRDVQAIFDTFLIEAGIVMTVIDDDVARLAVEAFARYGKGRGSPAQLNLGDCLSYACARHAGVPILFVGDDFGQTDLASADGG